MADDFLNFSSGDAGAAAPAPAAPQDDFLGGGAPAAQQDDFFGGGATSQPAAPTDDFLGGGQAATLEAPQDDFLSSEPQAQAPTADAGAPPADIMADNDAPPPPQQIEIPPLAKWEISNRETIAAKDGVAMENDSKIKKDAADVVSQFYSERKDLISANHDRNSGAESEFCKQRDALFATGQVWERVVSLIDVKASNEKKPTKVSRMRQLLLHMKNEAK